jgi:uncharacterized protein YkwD
VVIHRRVRLPVFIAAVLLAGAAAPAPAAPLDAINEVRASGCRGSGAPPLERVARLDAAAAGLARGRTLDDALSAAGYRADEALSIHVTGGADDRALRRILSERFCRDLGNRRVRHAGLSRDDRDLWLVIAAPFEPPSVADLPRVARRVLELTNAARARPRTCGHQRFAAAPPLALSGPLGEAALVHAREMAATERFAHEGPDGSTPRDRVARTGYRAALVGENIAAGPAEAEEVVAGWLGSPGHCANVMDPRFADMGLAYAVAARSRSGIYWAQVFARRGTAAGQPAAGSPSGAPRPRRSGSGLGAGTNSSDTELMQ